MLQMVHRFKRFDWRKYGENIKQETAEANFLLGGWCYDGFQTSEIVQIIRSSYFDHTERTPRNEAPEHNQDNVGCEISRMK
jgi:hypothetical protein